MDVLGLLIVAGTIALLAVLAARVWRGDRASDRGAMSSAMETRGELAAFNAALPDREEHSNRRESEG